MTQTYEQRLVKRSALTLLLRGVLAVLFGALVLLWPAGTVLAIVFLFGFYALVDGAANIAHYMSRQPRRSGWTLASGLVSVLAGILAFAWPGITALWLALLIGAWALVLGLTQIAVSLRAKRAGSGFWWVLLGPGIVTALFGLFMVVFPGAGILGLLGLVAAFSFVVGVLLLAAGFQLLRATSGRRLWGKGQPPRYAG